ncbi:MAG: tRNA pseudouridine(55) synthase TruB, partial [Candidatus Binataceae bacterium]
IILVDKPAGPTSAEIVRKIKAAIRAHSRSAPRVGHLGTLDPFATGLLPIMVGEATKLAPFIQAGEKEYEGTIALGVETDTLDPTGTPVRTAAVPSLDAARLTRLAAAYSGKIEQVAPIFSAIKRGGVPLYKRARQGEEIVPPRRSVEIMRLELEAADPAHLRFFVVCSGGTYIRSLARDIGAELGSAAHLASLRRMRSGGFRVERACSFEQVLRGLESGTGPPLIAPREALPTLAEVEIDAAREERLRYGDARALDGMVPSGAGLFKVIARGELAAIAQANSRLTATIARIFNRETGGEPQIGIR